MLGVADSVLTSPTLRLCSCLHVDGLLTQVMHELRQRGEIRTQARNWHPLVLSCMETLPNQSLKDKEIQADPHLETDLPLA